MFIYFAPKVHFDRQLEKAVRRTEQLNTTARLTGKTDQVDGPVLHFQRFDQFEYSKIDLSVCTLAQLLSPTKALFFVSNLNTVKVVFRLCRGSVRILTIFLLTNYEFY